MNSRYAYALIMITHKDNFMSFLTPAIATENNGSAHFRSNGLGLRITRLFLVLLAVAFISGCAGKKNKGGVNQDLAQQQVEELYAKAKRALDSGNYSFAIEYYRALEAAFPFGEYTEQAKLDMIFAFDKTRQPEKAIEAADNFIALYPTHKNVDYAYYMKGVATFEKKAGVIDRFVKGGKEAVRDPKPYKDSMEAFEELLKRYPNSKYADDAKQRMVFIRNSLAERELAVAQFYFDNRTYVASVNRCKYIVYRFETSPAVEGALKLMEKAYIEMGLDDLAASTRKVLVTNFPENEGNVYKKKKGFFSRINPFD